MTVDIQTNGSLAGLNRLFTAATHDASTAMRRWTQGRITLSLDEVRELPLECVCSELGLEDKLFTMVVLTMTGDVGGDMVLAFDEVDGRRLAAMLLNRPVATTPEWNELEQSALCETGNILSCAYLNALTRLLGCDLVPSPPYFVQDYAAGVIEQVLMMQAATSDRVLLCRTRFHREDAELDCHVFFVPGSEMRLRLDQALCEHTAE